MKCVLCGKFHLLSDFPDATVPHCKTCKGGRAAFNVRNGIDNPVTVEPPPEPDKEATPMTLKKRFAQRAI